MKKKSLSEKLNMVPSEDHSEEKAQYNAQIEWAKKFYPDMGELNAKLDALYEKTKNLEPKNKASDASTPESVIKKSPDHYYIDRGGLVMAPVKKYDGFNNWSFEFRKNELEKEFNRIREVMLGRTESVYPFIQSEDGNFDNDRIDEVINGMLSSLDRYIEISGDKKLNKTQREWYKAFLYCVLISPDVHTEWILPEYGHSRKFRDIISFSDFSGFDYPIQDLNEFIWYENHTWKMPEDERFDILFYACHAYCYLKDIEISDIYNRKEMEIYNTLLPTFEWGWGDRIGGLDILKTMEIREEEEKAASATGKNEKPKRIVSEEYITEPEDESPEYESEMEGWEEDPEYTLQRWEEEDEEFNRRAEIAAKTMEDWRARVADPDRFETEYKNLRKLFFKAELGRMKNDMEHLVDTYLYEHGLSAYSIDDNYGLVQRAVNGCRSTIETAIKRARIAK